MLQAAAVAGTETAPWAGAATAKAEEEDHTQVKAALLATVRKEVKYKQVEIKAIVEASCQKNYSFWTLWTFTRYYTLNNNNKC